MPEQPNPMSKLLKMKRIGEDPAESKKEEGQPPAERDETTSFLSGRVPAWKKNLIKAHASMRGLKMQDVINEIADAYIEKFDL